jgi:hypothetical protein
MAVTITPATLPTGQRSRIQASTMLLSEWLAAFRPSTVHLFQVRLGPTPQLTPGAVMQPFLVGLLRRFNRWADAISISPTEIEIIEASVVADPGKISQVETYMALAPSTPELAAYPSRRVTGSLLFATDDETIRQKAVAAGLGYYVYTPAWMQDYLMNRYYRPNRKG